MKKNNPIIFIIIVLRTLVAFGNKNNSIPYQKVARKIPDNFQTQYTSKYYNYEERDSTWLLEFKTWLIQKIISFFTFIKYDQGLYHLKVTCYFLIIGIAFYIILKTLFNKEGTWVFKKNIAKPTQSYQEDVAIIEVSNFELLIKKALTEHNYRLSVKFLYLWTLQKLAQKKTIELSNLKTNLDYQLELEDSLFYENFQQLSYYYTYVWYGEFKIDEASYQKISIQYKQFLKEITA